MFLLMFRAQKYYGSTMVQWCVRCTIFIYGILHGILQLNQRIPCYYYYSVQNGIRSIIYRVDSIVLSATCLNQQVISISCPVHYRDSFFGPVAQHWESERGLISWNNSWCSWCSNLLKRSIMSSLVWLQLLGFLWR